MQFVHAYLDESSGASPDTIWAHRSYVYWNLIDVVGPDGLAQYGGCEIGDTDIWIGDYTINPEDGGLGVFSHEYGKETSFTLFADVRMCCM